jgi:hypothetical protein
VSQIKLTASQLSSVNEYCKLNNIEDVDKFITKCYTEGFNTTKYGLLGDDLGKTDIVGEKQVEIEVIREIRVEVPVPNLDKIRDETKINELLLKIQQLENQEPIIKEVIVEVPVTNIDKICDKPEPNDKVKLLQETLQKLRKELSLKNTRIEELEKINKQNNTI